MLSSLSSALLFFFLGGTYPTEIYDTVPTLNEISSSSFKESSGTYKNPTHHFTLALSNEWSWSEKSSSGTTLVTFYPNKHSKNHFYTLSIEKEKHIPSPQERAFHSLSAGNEGNYIIDGANAAHSIENTFAYKPYKETLRISHEGYSLSFGNSHKQDPLFELLYLSFKSTKRQSVALQTCNKREKFIHEKWYSTLMEQMSDQYLLYEGALGSRDEVLKRYGTEMITPEWVNQICTSPNKEKILLIAGVDYMLRGKLFVYTPKNDLLERIPDPDSSIESFSVIKNGPNNTVVMYSFFGDSVNASGSMYSFSFNTPTLERKLHCNHQAIFDEHSDTYRIESDCIMEDEQFQKISYL